MKFLYKFKLFDRRRAKRFIPFPPFKCLVSCKARNTEGILGYIENISKTGILFICIGYQFCKDDNLDIQVSLPESSQLFILRGKVVRTYIVTMQGKFGNAVKLDTNDSQTKTSIEKILNYIKMSKRRK